MNIDFPFAFDSRGRTAECDDAAHVRDMLEQLLFTSAGERVNRPEFGSGLNLLTCSDSEFPDAMADELNTWVAAATTAGLLQ